MDATDDRARDDAPNGAASRGAAEALGGAEPVDMADEGGRETAFFAAETAQAEGPSDRFV